MVSDKSIGTIKRSMLPLMFRNDYEILYNLCYTVTVHIAY